MAPDPFCSLYGGGVEPSNAKICFVVGGCPDHEFEVKSRNCEELGYEPVCGEHKVEYDSCTSQGKRYVKCTCDPNYYMLTEKPTNEAAYDIEECETYDKKMRYRATCKSDYRFTLSTIKREDGETNSSVCGAGQTPAADSGICTMLYGNNVNKVLYKDCDCDSTYQYDEQKENGVVVEGFKYEGECKYTYGQKAGETWYTTVTCDTKKGYKEAVCESPTETDKEATHKGAGRTCRTCKCPARYKYASDKLTGNFAVDGNQCGDLYDDYKCLNGWTTDACFVIAGRKLCEIDTNTTYTEVKCYKTCKTQGGLTKNECWAKINNTADSSTHYCRKNTEFDDCYHFEEGGKCPIIVACPSGYYGSEDICKNGMGDGYKCSKATASEADGYTGCYKRVAKTCADYSESTTNTKSNGNSYCYYYHGSNAYGYVAVPHTRALGNSTGTCYGCEEATCSDYWYEKQGVQDSITGSSSYDRRSDSNRYRTPIQSCSNPHAVSVKSGSSDMACVCCGNDCPTSTVSCPRGVTVTFSGNFSNTIVTCPSGSAQKNGSIYTCSTGGTVIITVSCTGTGSCSFIVGSKNYSGTGAGSHIIPKACGDYIVMKQ